MRTFQRTKSELRTAIDQDDYGEGIDEKHAELTDEHQHVPQEDVAPKPQLGPQSKRSPMSDLHDGDRDDGQNKVL